MHTVAPAQCISNSASKAHVWQFVLMTRFRLSITTLQQVFLPFGRVSEWHGLLAPPRLQSLAVIMHVWFCVSLLLHFWLITASYNDWFCVPPDPERGASGAVWFRCPGQVFSEGKQKLEMLICDTALQGIAFSAERDWRAENCVAYFCLNGGEFDYKSAQYGQNEWGGSNSNKPSVLWVRENFLKEHEVWVRASCRIALGIASGAH